MAKDEFIVVAMDQDRDTSWGMAIVFPDKASAKELFKKDDLGDGEKIILAKIIRERKA